jgi:hypothetical protein
VGEIDVICNGIVTVRLPLVDANPFSSTLTPTVYVPDGALLIVQLIDVVVAAVTIHEPVVPIVTLFELSVVLKPVPVITTDIPLCMTDDIDGV